VAHVNYNSDMPHTNSAGWLTCYCFPLPRNEEKSDSEGGESSSAEAQDENAPPGNSIKAEHWQTAHAYTVSKSMKQTCKNLYRRCQFIHISTSSTGIHYHHMLNFSTCYKTTTDC